MKSVFGMQIENVFFFDLQTIKGSDVQPKYVKFKKMIDKINIFNSLSVFKKKKTKKKLILFCSI